MGLIQCITGQLTFTPVTRNDVLFPVLAHTTLNGVPFTPKDPMGIHVQGDHRTARMGRHLRLGCGKGTNIIGLDRSAKCSVWKRTVIRVARRDD